MSRRTGSCPTGIKTRSHKKTSLTRQANQIMSAVSTMGKKLEFLSVTRKKQILIFFLSFIFWRVLPLSAECARESWGGMRFKTTQQSPLLTPLRRKRRRQHRTNNLGQKITEKGVVRNTLSANTFTLRTGIWANGIDSLQ